MTYYNTIILTDERERDVISGYDYMSGLPGCYRTF